MPTPDHPPTVSVVMSAYNGARFVSEAVEGVLAQSFGDLEFLIADDASVDGTWEILDGYARQDNRIRLRQNEKNLGVAASVNNLFREARGQYITRHDSDDISLPGKLAAQVAYLDNNPEVGLLATQVAIIDEAGQPFSDFHFFTTEAGNEVLQKVLLTDCYLCQGSVMFRRELLDAAGLYDDFLVPAEDYDLWLRFAELTRLASLGEVNYLYRVHPGGQSQSKFPQQIYGKAIALDRALQRRFADLPTDHTEHSAGYYLQAAVAKYDCCQLAAGRFSLARAVQLSPSVIQNSARLYELLADYTSRRSLHEALWLIQTILDDLPPAAYPRHVIARLYSMMYMREVFADARLDGVSPTLTYLVRGLQYDPSWLKNWGVLVRLLKLTLRKLALGDG